MSILHESWQDRNERRDRERSAYHGDVMYDVWRGGGNPDRVSYDRESSAFYDGTRADTFAHSLLAEERAHQQRAREEEAYWDHLAAEAEWEHHLAEEQDGDPFAEAAFETAYEEALIAAGPPPEISNDG